MKRLLTGLLSAIAVCGLAGEAMAVPVPVPEFPTDHSVEFFAQSEIRGKTYDLSAGTQIDWLYWGGDLFVSRIIQGVATDKSEVLIAFMQGNCTERTQRILSMSIGFVALNSYQRIPTNRDNWTEIKDNSIMSNACSKAIAALPSN